MGSPSRPYGGLRAAGLCVADRSSATELDDRVLDDPDVKLGISGRSGPITMERQYRIDPQQARDFYNLMLEVRVSRARPGTYDWSLSRDIADHEIWSERFSCPTWDDELRLRSRRTLEDITLHLRARNMHIGMEQVRISRWLGRPTGSVRWHEQVPDRSDDGLHW